MFPRDLTGKVSVEGPYVVLNVRDGAPGGQVPYRVDVVELETGVVHVAAESSLFHADVQRTPKRDTLIFDGLASTSSAERSVMYLQDDGFVPPKLPPGYSDETLGTFFSLWEWSADGRFGAAWREATSGEAYVDLVDAHSGGRWGSVPVADTGALFWFGGHTFAYRSEDPELWRTGMLSVMPDGLWDFTLPSGAGRWTIGSDGRFYYTLVDGATTQLFMHAPGQDTPTALPVPEGFTLGALLSAAPGGSSVLSQVLQDDDSRHVYRLHADGSPPERVAELVGLASLLSYQTRDQQWQLLELRADGQSSIVAIRLSDLSVTELTQAAQADVQDFGTTGDHFFLVVEGSPITFVGFEQGTAVSVPLEGSEATGSGECLSDPLDAEPERRVVRVAPERLVMLGLAQPRAQVVGSVEPSLPGATLDCPVWSRDGASFTYAEHGEETTRVFVVNWVGAEPSAPELVFESEEDVSPIGLR